MREIHCTLTAFNQVSLISSQQTKTVLDAWNGYHNLLFSSTGKDTTISGRRLPTTGEDIFRPGSGKYKEPSLIWFQGAVINVQVLH